VTTRSRQQERRGAADMGLRTTAASGSKTVKNDARAARDGRAYPESAEFKTTGNIYYRLHLDDLVKAARHASEDQRMMLFGIEFQNAARGASSWRYVVMEESDYLELIGRVRELEYELNDLYGTIAILKEDHEGN
jgi:hypothetical protein